MLAGVVSVAWFALCGWYGWQRAPQDFTVPERIFRPESVLFLLSALAPALLLFGFAALARRLADLRQSAASIAHVAVRLAEPESMATDQLSTLAQAIRREISSMGEGVERAFSRASELETLVRNEVATLERSSSEQERRLRALIAELADQREALLAKGEALRTAIAEAHGGAARELDVVAERIARKVGDIGETATATLSASSDLFAVTVERASKEGVARISGVSEDVARRLGDAAEESAQSLMERAERLDEVLRERAEGLVAEIGQRQDAIGLSFAEFGGTRGLGHSQRGAGRRRSARNRGPCDQPVHRRERRRDRRPNRRQRPRYRWRHPRTRRRRRRQA